MSARRRRYYDDDDDPRDEGDSTGGVIPYKNTPALLAYYFGVFSLVPCFGIVLGIVAVILGIMGLRKYSENPRIAGVVHAWIGIILGGGMALLNLGILCVLIVLPLLTRS